MPHLSRREWLAAASCLSGAGALFAAPKRTIPLGFSLYGMKTLPLADAIRACARIGYDGVELALIPGYPCEPKLLGVDGRKELRTRLADAKLRLLGLMENLVEPADEAGHRANLDRLKAAAELGQALAPDAPPPIETVLGGKPAEWERVRERLAERLRDWAAVGKDAKTVIAVKPHVGNALHTIDGASGSMKQVDSPWLRLAFDFSHFRLRDVPLATAVEKLIPLSAFVHVKDAKGTPEKFEFLLPGEAGIDDRVRSSSRSRKVCRPPSSSKSAV